MGRVDYYHDPSAPAANMITDDLHSGRIVRSVRRIAGSPRLWVGHVLVALAAGVFIALGVWQYDRAQSASGDFQNLGYALQWPLFAVFAVVAWWRVLHLEQRRLEQHPDHTEDPPVPSAPTTRQQPVQEDDPDDELAAYNAYLARLAAQDSQP